MYNRDVSISCLVAEIRLGWLEGCLKKLQENFSEKDLKKLLNSGAMMDYDNALQ